MTEQEFIKAIEKTGNASLAKELFDTFTRLIELHKKVGRTPEVEEIGDKLLELSDKCTNKEGVTEVIMKQYGDMADAMNVCVDDEEAERILSRKN